MLAGGGGEEEESWCTSYQTQKSRRGPEGQLHCICVLLSQYYCYFWIEQINPFRLSLIHSVIDSQSFQISLKIFSQSALTGEPKNIFFTEAQTHFLWP